LVAARYEERLFRLYLKMEGLTALFADPDLFIEPQ